MEKAEKDQQDEALDIKDITSVDSEANTCYRFYLDDEAMDAEVLPNLQVKTVDGRLYVLFLGHAEGSSQGWRGNSKSSGF